LIWPHDNHATPFSIDATHAENINATFQVRAEYFLIFTKPVAALPGQKEGGHVLQGKLVVTLLKDGPYINHGVDIFARRGLSPDRRLP
jgi:hypothetical protein